MSYSACDFVDDVYSEMERLGLIPMDVQEQIEELSSNGEETISECADAALGALSDVVEQRNAFLVALETITEYASIDMDDGALALRALSDIRSTARAAVLRLKPEVANG